MYIEKVNTFLAQKYPEEPPKACVRSFGCQQNSNDGEKIKGLLSVMGYSFTDDTDDADIVIFNTCAVRENAELKIFGIVGEMKHLKKRKPDVLIGICGCMVQQEHIVEKIRRTYKQVDFVFGTFAMHKLPEILYKALTERTFIVDTAEYGITENICGKIVRDCTYKAGVQIMYGCNNFCTYCIVPYVRGRERSRKSDEIIAEIKGLVADGVKEIMLLGQNVNSYGRGLDEDIDFSRLLRKINGIDGDFRIRFMSSHPKDAGRELIDAILECEKVCKHLHLPVQSGSDRVLSAMNRGYTSAQYREIVDYARSKKADFSFSTDIIVGFPNETREEFEETLELLEYVKFDSVFSFIYSKRNGTKAALIEDGVDYPEKAERMNILLKKQREIAVERYSSFIGREMLVLIDGPSATEGKVTGKSDEFIIVEVDGDSSLAGEYVKVRIIGAHNWALIGNIIN